MSEPADFPDGTDRLREGAVAPERRPLAEILDRLPQSPGVYIMKDVRAKILYIGKAANLRNRVRQYFQPNTGDSRDFVPLLESVVADIETVLTSNEKEALLVENTLIKKHQPRFNVKMRDDKNYLSLRLDPNGEWPRLEVVRRMKDDGAFHFGPYHSASSCRQALRVVNRHFQLRTCTDHVLHNRRRPCLQFQIKRCPAPCVLPVARDDYGDQVRDVRLFLDGKSAELLDRLRARMRDAATAMDFERAALVRDQIRALESTLESQRVVSSDFVDQDVFGFYREGTALDLAVMSIRDGKMVGNRCFSFKDQEFPDSEVLSSFLGLYYDMAPTPPDEVLLPFAIGDEALKADWLSEMRNHPRGRRVEVMIPQRGSRRALLELAQKNAAASFSSRRNSREDAEANIAKLQRRLRLPQLPRVIECYDISHVQGSDPVASMVVFIDGKPEKSRYRTFKIRRGGNIQTGPDDFASMYEVLSRRLRRARESQENDGAASENPWRLPDLIVVDGGKGQLGMALAAARDVGIDIRVGIGLPIIGLAKERDFAGSSKSQEKAEAEVGRMALESVVTEASEMLDLLGDDTEEMEAPTDMQAANGKRPDRVFLPHAKDPIAIRANSAEMFVLQQLRDEAHRFAVAFHRATRKRRTLRSALSDVPGIGPTRQRTLLRHFGSLKKIREATIEDLLAVEGINSKVANAVLRFFLAQRPVSAEVDATTDADDEALESAFSGIDEGLNQG